MKSQAITVSTTVSAPPATTWHYYTESEHVINWNFASPDWHCPKAINELEVGGVFSITMAAKDGSMSFDMEGTYDEIEQPKHLAYTLSNGRKVKVDFAATDNNSTKVTITFDPEEDNSPEQQQEGWQAIADNFKKYVAGVES